MSCSFGIKSCIWLLCLTPGVVLAQQSLVGVTMDLPGGHPSRYGSTITSARVDPPNPIRFDVNGNGYRYPNRSGSDIKGFRLQVEDGDRYRFDESLCSGERIFAKMRSLDDGETIEFGDGILSDEDELWIYMPNRSQGGRRIYYLGEALSSDPIPETTPTRTDPLAIKRELLWIGFRQVCPSKYRQFSTYGVTTELTHLCFVARGIVFIYDDEDKALLEVQHTGRFEDGMPNCITFKNNDKGAGLFVLWRNGKEIVRIELDSLAIGQRYEAHGAGR